MEKSSVDVTKDERRRTPRIAMEENVTIRISTDEIVGPGQNMSAQGVFFVANTSLKVSVSIQGVAEPVEGHLVRVQQMGEGKLGIAVRFTEAPNLPPD